MNVLHICANPKPTEESISKQLAAAFFTKLVGSSPDTEMTNLDLCSEPPPFFTYKEFRNFYYPLTMEGYVPTKEEEADSAYAIQQADIFNAADVLVLTTPVWGFTIPGILKTWLDHITAPGLVSEQTDDDGFTAKHHVKRVVCLVSSAEVFKEGDPRDGLTPAITAIFDSMGIEEVSFAWADGQNNDLGDSGERFELAKEAAEDLAEELTEELGATPA